MLDSEFGQPAAQAPIKGAGMVMSSFAPVQQSPTFGIGVNDTAWQTTPTIGTTIVSNTSSTSFVASSLADA